MAPYPQKWSEFGLRRSKTNQERATPRNTTKCSSSFFWTAENCYKPLVEITSRQSTFPTWFWRRKAATLEGWSKVPLIGWRLVLVSTCHGLVSNHFRYSSPECDFGNVTKCSHAFFCCTSFERAVKVCPLLSDRILCSVRADQVVVRVASESKTKEEP